MYIQEILDKAENAFQLKDDIEVKFLCKVDFYPPHGAVRLIVESIDPVYTLGKIAQERQRLIALLKKKGVLKKNKQLILSDVPLTIGLVTAFDSAAYNDFISELQKSHFAFKVFFVNSLIWKINKNKREVNKNRFIMLFACNINLLDGICFFIKIFTLFCDYFIPQII